jgi:hypothetical protein
LTRVGAPTLDRRSPAQPEGLPRGERPRVQVMATSAGDAA